MTEFEYLWSRRSDVRLRALTNRIYYQERQRIFELREGIIKVISIFGGSLAFAKMASPGWVGWCAATITLCTAASLVFGFGTKARDSAKRSSEWALLERDIELAGEREFTELNLSTWRSRCNEIEAGEPSAHPGMFEKAYIRACAALSCTPTGPATLGFWHRNFPPFFIP